MRSIQDFLKSNRTLLAACVLIIALMNVIVRDFVQDDGYITFRYADNFTNHGTLYYNLNMRGPYGYSNPLYVFILSAIRLISLKLLSFEIISRVIASFSLGVILFMLLNKIPKKLRTEKKFFLSSIAFLVYTILIFPFLLPNFFSGLETALFTLSLFVLMSSIFVDPIDEKWFMLWLGIALTLRIDSIFLLIPLMIIYVIKPTESPNRKRIKLRNIIIVLTYTTVFFLLHYVLTGNLVPLSFGHKSNPFSLTTFLNYIKFSVIVLSPLSIVLLGRNNRSFGLIFFATLYILYINFFYSFFMEWHFNRYIFPVVFSLFSVFLLTLIKTLEKVDTTNIALLSVYMLFMYIPGTLQGFSWVSGYRVAMSNLKQIANVFLESDIDENYRTFATYDAGYITYKTGWDIIDLYGLTTPEVVHDDIGRVIAERNPTVLIVTTGIYVEPSAVTLFSQYQEAPSVVPSNYYFLKHLPLTNQYWWSWSQYSYYIFVNENANPALVTGLMNITVDVEKEIGYQKYIFRFLQILSSLRL